MVWFGALSGVVAGAEPVRAEVSLGLRPELWIGSWAAAVAALSAVYVFDRRHRASRWQAAKRVAAVPMTRDHIEPVGRSASAEAAPASEAPPRRRTIEELIKRKPGAPADAPLPFSPRTSAAPAPPAPAPETALLRRLRERGELVARVAAPVPLERLAEEHGEEATPAEQATTPAEGAPEVEILREPTPVERCAALREAGDFEGAVAAARDGLARYADEPGRLLLELSRATLALGRCEEAIDSARDALFVWRSPACVEHLLRMLTALHRFEREDGDTLRRAAERHPERPALRHALGVYELAHGSRAAAEAELRAALELDVDDAERSAIERDLARVRR